jgi:molybdenum cofactor synthesis domain-containing protein
MRPFTSTISVAEARRQILSHAAGVERRQWVSLREAPGRVAACDVRARADVPPFDRAAMDGYAVRAADTGNATPEAPARLRRIAIAYTGDAPAGQVDRGTCVEIATGAPVPPGADAVVMVEHTGREGVLVEVRHPVHPGQNIGRRANDLAHGDLVVRCEDWLSPARVGALAAAGVAEVEVFARPLVAIASTGNEIVEPGRRLPPGCIHDVNRFTLAPVIRAHGGEVLELPTIADSVEAVREAVDAAAGADLLVFTGGSSVGERDVLVDAVTERGQVVFHGVAMKPGKPTLFARLGPPATETAPHGAAAARTALFLGLSGNPASCLANAYILLVPLLRAMARLPEWVPQRVSVPLAAGVVGGSGRHQFLPVRLERATAVATFKGSGEITSLSRADGYIEIPPDVDRIEAGEIVTVTLFASTQGS